MINKSCFLRYSFCYSSLIIYISLVFVFVPTLSLAQSRSPGDAPGGGFAGRPIIPYEQQGLVTTPTTSPRHTETIEGLRNKPAGTTPATEGAKSGNRFGIYSMACTTIQSTVLDLACNQKAYASATKPVTDRFEQMMANNSNGSQKDQCQLVQQMNEATKKINQSITGKCHTAILSCKTTCGMALKNAKVAHAAAIEPTAKAMFWAEMTAISKSMASCASKWASVKKTSDLQIARNTDAIKQAKDCVDGLGGSGELSDSSNCDQLPLAKKNLCQQLGEVAFCKQHPKIDFCHSVDSLFAGKKDAPGPGHTNANAITSNPLKQRLPRGGGGGQTSRRSIATRLSHV